MKRYGSMLLAAAVISMALGAFAPRMSVVSDLCQSLSPDSWLYALLGCGKDSAGGGGSGAGL
jgi:hypothetical protein